ncbi:MAG TPA: hypothetical protein VHX16_05995, partial [Chloroflexota bacterium]|nr:hypothetical protein [Chloroflexota bacterium]
MESTRQPGATRADGGTRFRMAIMLCLAMIVGLASSFIAGDQQTGIGGNGNNPYAIGLWGD